MNKQLRTLIVLRRARENIALYGWIQGASGSRVRGFCARGAIHAATRSQDLRFEANAALIDTIGGQWNYDIITWNDAVQRTGKQVIRAFDRTIKRLEKEDAK